MIRKLLCKRYKIEYVKGVENTYHYKVFTEYGINEYCNQTLYWSIKDVREGLRLKRKQDKERRK